MSLRDELRIATEAHLKKSPNVDAAFANAVHHMKEATVKGRFSCKMMMGSRILASPERRELIARLALEEIEITDHPKPEGNDPREQAWTELSWK